MDNDIKNISGSLNYIMNNRKHLVKEVTKKELHDLGMTADEYWKKSAEIAEERETTRKTSETLRNVFKNIKNSDITALAHLGISLYDSDGNMKNFSTIIDEIIQNKVKEE